MATITNIYSFFVNRTELIFLYRIWIENCFFFLQSKSDSICRAYIYFFLILFFSGLFTLSFCCCCTPSSSFIPFPLTCGKISAISGIISLFISSTIVGAGNSEIISSDFSAGKEESDKGGEGSEEEAAAVVVVVSSFVAGGGGGKFSDWEEDSGGDGRDSRLFCAIGDETSTEILCSSVSEITDCGICSGGGGRVSSKFFIVSSAAFSIRAIVSAICSGFGSSDDSSRGWASIGASSFGNTSVSIISGSIFISKVSSTTEAFLTSSSAFSIISETAAGISLKTSNLLSTKTVSGAKGLSLELDMADSANTDTWDGGGFEGRGGGGLTVLSAISTVVSSFKISFISSSSFTSILGSSIFSAVSSFVWSTFSTSTISIGFVSSTTTIGSSGVFISSSGFVSSISIIGAAAITDATIVSSVTVSTIIGAATDVGSCTGAGVVSISTFGCSTSTAFGVSVIVSAIAFGASSVFSSVGVSVGVVMATAAVAASVSSFCGCWKEKLRKLIKIFFFFCYLIERSQKFRENFKLNYAEFLLKII